MAEEAMQSGCYVLSYVSFLAAAAAAALSRLSLVLGE